jgi:hypothetical protein
MQVPIGSTWLSLFAYLSIFFIVIFYTCQPILGKLLRKSLLKLRAVGRLHSFNLQGLLYRVDR